MKIFLLLMVIGYAFESQSTVSAYMRARPIQIDEDFRMTKRTATTITRSNPSGDDLNGLLMDQVDCW